MHRLQKVMSNSTRTPLIASNDGGYGATSTATPEVAAVVIEEKVSPNSNNETIQTVIAQGGLSQSVVNQRRAIFGLNELPEKRVSHWHKFFMKFWGPMPWLIEIAVLLSGFLHDWKDFGFLLALLIINGLLAFYEEFKAGNAVDELKKGLARQARVYRDGEWTKIESNQLVPGDVVMLRLGDIVPADCKLGGGEPMDVDQAALTGESLPVTKFEGDTVYSGSCIKRGEVFAIVSETGEKTFFGKAASMVSSVEQTGHFQIVLWQVAQFLMAMAFIMVLIIFFTQVLGNVNTSIPDVIKLCLVLLVASIPIAMQVVCTGTMAVGSRTLAKHHALVSRLSSIEELAGMDVLCSDKTGTLTQNKLTLDTPWVFTPTTANEYGSAEMEMRRKLLVLNGALSSQWEGDMEAIDAAITGYTKYVDLERDVIQIWHRPKFVPFNPTAKRTMAYIEPVASTPFNSGDTKSDDAMNVPSTDDSNDTKKSVDDAVQALHRWTVSKGSPQVIVDLCFDSLTPDERQQVELQINLYASRGYRTLGVARKKGFAAPYGQGDFGSDDNMPINLGWEFLGLIPMFDPPRHDTKRTIERAVELGINVKMVTGDHGAIGIDTARRLGMGSNILGTHIFQEVDTFGGTRTQFDYTDIVEHADGFAEVFPEHKFLIVELLQKGGHIVGMTGDGVNDAPALKKADVGIAVQGATDAASAAADIVLTDSGLSTIIMGINIAREIFQRMKNYCIYRISATIQILFFFLMSIIIFDFKLPVFVIVLISIINDGTIITIAYDNVKASARPESWNLPVVCGVAMCLGSVSVLFTFMMLYLSLPRDPHNMNIICNNGLSLNITLQKECQSYLSVGFNLPVLEIDQVQALIYLQLSLSGQLTVFSARTRGWFFSRAPGRPLVLAFFVAQLCSTILAVYPLGELQPMLGLACSGSNGVCQPGSYTINGWNGWKYAGFAWCYCLIVFIIQDVVKVIAYHVLDYQNNVVNERKRATIRMQRENRLKEDEVRPRRDPASSYERAQMRVNMERRR